MEHGPLFDWIGEQLTITCKCGNFKKAYKLKTMEKTRKAAKNAYLDHLSSTY